MLAEVLDKRFKNVAEVEQALALPFLGFIPRHALPKRRPPALITLQKPWSAAAEAYHTVRTWIQLAQPPVRSLLVTSACRRVKANPRPRRISRYRLPNSGAMSCW